MPTPVDSIATSATTGPTASGRPLATQQAALQRWLESRATAPSATSKPTRTNASIQTKTVHKLPADEKVATLREALAANGLTALPDPLHRFPVHKVVRVQDLLRHEI